jgi:hypothetical protein
MSFLDKLSGIAKSTGDLASDVAKSAGNLAKNAGDKANGALEISKLNTKIKTEKTNIDNEYAKLGAYYYAKHSSGESLDAGAEEFCTAIDAANAVIAGLEAEIAAIHAKHAAEKAAHTNAQQGGEAPRRFCSKCGAQLTEGALFCASCGEKLE